MSRSFVCIVFLFSVLPVISSLQAREYIATVERLRGNVTQLGLGDIQARRISVGDRLRAETSLVTGARSFVRVKFDDGTLLNVAPDAQVVINRSSDEQRPGVISLLRGSLRTRIDNSRDDEKHKLYLKTRTAALGVRGTDVQIGYHPDNDITSTLTYTGEVSKSYIDEREFLKNLGRTSVRTRNVLVRSNGHEPELREVEVADGVIGLDDIFESSFRAPSTVQVRRGQYSGSVHRFKNNSSPVKLSPLQLRMLYENEDFELKEREVRTVRGEGLLTEGEVWPQQADQSAPPEGVYDPRRKLYAPKAGGFLDFKSGIYVPPGEDSEYDRAKGVYIPSRLEGAIDVDTGQYVPPRGLILDPKLGFLVSPSIEEDSDQGRQLLAMRESLNHNIASDVVLASPFESALPDRPVRVLSLREQYTKDLVDFRFFRGSQEIDYTDDPSRADFTIGDASSSRLDIDWYHASSGRFQVISGFSYRKVAANDTGSPLNYESDTLLDLRIGSRYYLDSRWSLYSLLALSQNHFLNFIEDENGGGEQEGLERVVIPRLKFGADGELIHAFAGKLRIGVKGDISYGLSKNAGDFDIGSSLGLSVSLYARYWVSRSIWTEFGVEQSRESYDFTAEGDTRGSQSLTNGGVFLSLGMGL